MNKIMPPTIPCPDCGRIDAWEIVKCKNQGGTVQYFYMCHCGHRQTQYIKHALIDAAALTPREVLPKRPRNKCEVCKADGAENHHWAPFAIFGDDAHMWPQSFLCTTCHTRWHRLMTPGIGTKSQQ